LSVVRLCYRGGLGLKQLRVPVMNIGLAQDICHFRFAELLALYALNADRNMTCLNTNLDLLLLLQALPPVDPGS
jgi:hypothetical protein